MEAVTIKAAVTYGLENVRTGVNVLRRFARLLCNCNPHNMEIAIVGTGAT